MSKKAITFVTSNTVKLEGFLEILGPSFSRQIKSCNISLPEFPGPMGETSFKKCEAAAGIIRGPVLVEVTSLCLDIFGGMSGPYMNWFTDSRLAPRNLYRSLAGFENKKAYAVSDFVYSSGDPGDLMVLFRGTASGTIVRPSGPTDSYDWDSCFQPDDLGVTYAEIPKEMKNKVSHRFRGVEKLKRYLSEALD